MKTLSWIVKLAIAAGALAWQGAGAQVPMPSRAASVAAANLTIVNLEIPLTNATSATTRKSAAAVRAKMQFILKADPAHIGSLAGCGVDAVSLGNNHVMDFQTAGLIQMTDLLRKKGVISCARSCSGRDLS